MPQSKKQPTLEEFKAWARGNYRLAMAVVQAQALSEVTRKRVDEYIRPVFESFAFNYCGPLAEKTGNAGSPVPSTKELYLCEDPRITDFYAACDEAHKAHGYELPAGHCPSLVTEHLYIVAQNALIESGNQFLGITDSPYGELREKYLKLLVGVCLKK